MKIAFIGLGSIARKHIAALKQLDKTAIIFAVRHQETPSEKEGINTITFSALSTLDLDAIIITNPSVYHTQNILDLVHLRIPIMVEKPLCISNGQRKKLQQLNTQDLPIIYTACNLRFHPLIQYLKAYLNENTLTIFEVNAYCGSYLPSWRPDSDYRSSYSAQEAMGGGVHLDLMHELDYLHFLFGKPKAVEKVHKKYSTLDLDSVDYAHYWLDFKDFSATITLNYFRRDSKRTLEIVTDQGTIELDFISGTITLLAQKEILYEVGSNAMEQSYINQINYFLSLINHKEKPMNTLIESLDIIQHVL